MIMNELSGILAWKTMGHSGVDVGQSDLGLYFLMRFVHGKNRTITNDSMWYFIKLDFCFCEAACWYQTW